ncbi:hypothetical protein B0A69_12360 [Chryseobacterium shigense]|uniref:Uncharacterized protein n=1 Tax=Chryseobacterium shigense TaxID=297244 RepID=A0A1N7JSP9_9FLAO|nr:hypothetical protein [Chryseobacterium shigense]PQA92958.1 hypothetical protein B0A69_12360 [Chryseobacterium shigense]SIS52335.1 hypothetical protein SAMN05421639_107140 [Chryseobacterium shigense]
MLKINFETRIDFTEKKIQEFLFDKNQQNYQVNPPVKSGFFYASDKVANDQMINASYQQKVTYSIREFWSVIQNNISVQNNPITIVYEQEVDINPEYLIYFREGISNEALAYAKDIISQYRFDTGIAIEEWIQSKLNMILTEDMFYIDTSLYITKIGDRIEFNADQRYAFLRVYRLIEEDPSKDKPVKSQVHIIDDGDLSHWQKESKTRLEKLKYEELILDNIEPKQNPTIKEYPANSPIPEAQKITDVLSVISSSLIPSDCGVMNFKTIKLLTLFNFPEFKVEMVDHRIRIGCSDIIISLPVLRMRNAEIVFYIYYSVPDDITQVLLKIMTVCATRAALEAAVLGVITSNPAVAIAVFNNQFKNCIQQEALKCINPGIMTIKETDDWR